jgi:hypothetical protein
MVEYIFLFHDPEYVEMFRLAVLDAVRRDAVLEILLMCPCSPTLAAHAEEMGMRPSDLVRGIESTLRELFRLFEKLGRNGERHITVKLNSQPPVVTGYQYGNKILMKPGPSAPLDRVWYVEVRASSAWGATWDEQFRDRWRAGVHMMEHMTGELTILGAVESQIVLVKFVAHGGNTYVAIDQRDVVEALNIAPQVLWHHGDDPTSLSIPVPLRRSEDQRLLSVLDGRVEDKYGSKNKFFFFRLDQADGGVLSLQPPTTRVTD